MSSIAITPQALLFLPALLLSIICHEIGHAYAAYLGGDDTASLQCRISLNPLVHIDPIGTVLIPILQVLFGIPLIGWAKPVPVNPMRLRSAKWNLAVSLSGVGVNLCLAILAALLIRICLSLGIELFRAPIGAEYTTANLFGFFLRGLIHVNLVLMVFNLLPIPPLDGSHVLLHFIRTRDSAAFSVFQFLERFGFIILILLLYTGVLGLILYPALRFMLGIVSFIFRIPLV